MSDDEQKRIGELLNLYSLEDVKDIYVEGAFDKDVYQWFLRTNGRNDVSVYSIDVVEIPAEKFEQYNLSYPSNRSKLIVLSCELDRAKNIESTVLCIADRDYEDFLPTVVPNSFLTFTDFNSLESYVLDFDIMSKFISIGLGRLPFEANILIPQLFKVLKSLFFIRLANEKLVWNMQWINLNRYLKVSRDSIIFEESKFITALLQRNNYAANKVEFQTEIATLISTAPSEEKLLIRGHDLMVVFHFVANKLRAKRHYEDVQFFSGAFIASLGIDSLRDYSLFKNLIKI